MAAGVSLMAALRGVRSREGRLAALGVFVVEATASVEVEEGLGGEVVAGAACFSPVLDSGVFAGVGSLSTSFFTASAGSVLITSGSPIEEPLPASFGGLVSCSLGSRSLGYASDASSIPGLRGCLGGDGAGGGDWLRG